MKTYLIVGTKYAFTEKRFPTLFGFLNDEKRCADYAHLNSQAILFRIRPDTASPITTDPPLWPKEAGVYLFPLAPGEYHLSEDEKAALRRRVEEVLIEDGE